MFREFFLGFVKIHVLYYAAQQPVYGFALLDELRRHGYDLSPGTLYPILHGLEEAGYLVREDQLIGGKVRKYYAITDEGQRALAEARNKVRELVHDVLEEADGLAPPTAKGGEGTEQGQKKQRSSRALRAENP